MSRASYIWIVTNAQGGILAAFTVKHELVSWLRSEPGKIRWWNVERVRDGNPALLGEVYGVPGFLERQS
jgi:hypothetical protein